MSRKTLIAGASLPLMAAILLAGCQTSGPAGSARSVADRDPRVSGIVVVRSYEDEFKTESGDVRVTVEYAIVDDAHDTLPRSGPGEEVRCQLDIDPIGRGQERRGRHSHPLHD